MRNRVLSLFLVGPLALCLLSEAQGATFEIVSQTPAYETPALSSVLRTIRLKGPIEAGDSGKLKDLLVEMKASATAPSEPLIVAELSGPGGDLLEGIKIGDLFAEFRISTIVRKGEQCLGACVVALVGGSTGASAAVPPTPSRFIEIGATVGIQNFYNPPPLRSRPSKYPVEGLLAYAARQGIDKGLRARLIGEAPDKILYVTNVEAFLAVNACPIGLGLPSTSIDVQAANVCSQSARSLDRHVPLRTVELTEKAARVSLLKYVKLHIWWLGVVGDRRTPATQMLPPLRSELAERLKSDQFVQSDEAATELYSDLKAAGIPLPDLLGATFEVSGYNTANDQITCIASLSRDDVHRYDVVTQGPDGMKAAAQFAPRQCRGLFRYDVTDTINPG